MKGLRGEISEKLGIWGVGRSWTLLPHDFVFANQRWEWLSGLHLPQIRHMAPSTSRPMKWQTSLPRGVPGAIGQKIFVIFFNVWLVCWSWAASLEGQWKVHRCWKVHLEFVRIYWRVS